MADSVEYPDLVIVGAGLFGLTVAQQAVEHTGARVHIIDIRDHIGGNAYSYMDEETGAEIHKYGAHLFHTSNKRVWDYVNRFTSFTDYVHRVYATHDGEVYPLPINLGTINQFFHAHYTPAEAKAHAAGALPTATAVAASAPCISGPSVIGTRWYVLESKPMIRIRPAGSG